MERKIVGFYQDDEQHWVAELDCFHGQHVRHDPPLVSRPWVLTENGRASRLGETLDCVRCDQLEWPDGLVAYKKTPVFTEKNVPNGLLKQHSTKRGVWAKICVTKGRLFYHVRGRTNGLPFVLEHNLNGIISPEMSHYIAVPEPVSFYIEFYTRG